MHSFGVIKQNKSKVGQTQLSLIVYIICKATFCKNPMEIGQCITQFFKHV